MTGDYYVLPGLMRKRAELARDLILTESKADELRAAIIAIDDAIRVYDPKAIPASIKPKRARTPVTPLPYGHPSRMMLDILRVSPEPMTARQIVEELARRCGLPDLSATKRKTLLTKVRNVMARNDGRTVTGEARDGKKYWRIS